MSVVASQGGLLPDSVVERQDAILQDSQRLITRYHEARHGAMTQVALAPCSPFSVSRDLMRPSASMARSLVARLHTHLAENDHDTAYTREKFACCSAPARKRPTPWSMGGWWCGRGSSPLWN